MIQCKWAQLVFSILHFSVVNFLWQVILTLESDAVVSVVFCIYFFSPNFWTSFIVRESAKVWPGSKSTHFKNNPTKNWKLEELLSCLEEKSKIPKIGFGRGKCVGKGAKTTPPLTRKYQQQTSKQSSQKFLIWRKYKKLTRNLPCNLQKPVKTGTVKLWKNSR